MTRAAVGLVLVEGRDGDGATVDRNAIEFCRTPWSSPRQASDEAAAAVLRAEAIAADLGLRLHSVGVTWGADADLEASLLLKSLNECGFDNVAPVELSDASEALAWGVADVMGDDVTAVCVLDSDRAIALVVNAREGAVQSATNDSIDSVESLIGWLSAVFAKADWPPQALVMVGSDGDLDAVMPSLEARLPVPVLAPSEAQVALARGAALASAQHPEMLSETAAAAQGGGPKHRRHRPQGRPLAMLAIGTATFVASASAAISMQLAPAKDTAPPQPAPAAVSSPDVAVGARPAAPPIAAVPAPPPAQVPLPAEPPAQPPAAPVEVAALPESPAETAAAPEAPVVAVPEAPVLPPASMAPGLVPAVPTPVPEHRGFLQRIRDRLSNIGDNGPAPAPSPAEPGVAPAAVPPAPAVP
ncbi:hypothetical protein A5663_18175 [Mycobacterium sp. E740]|nr:hypothetical protein A5663_18175 [Mycobacterium sp. E740]